MGVFQSILCVASGATADQAALDRAVSRVPVSQAIPPKPFSTSCIAAFWQLNRKVLKHRYANRTGWIRE